MFASREINRAATRGLNNLKLRSFDQYHRALTLCAKDVEHEGLNKDVEQNAAGPLSKKRVIEKLWREFFSDPSQWWDHRSEKENSRYPNFKHKKTQDGLWLIDRNNPPWVGVEMAAMAPGTLQASKFSWNKRLHRYVNTREYGKAIELFQQMQEEGMNPDKLSFIRVLTACSRIGALEQGRCIHAQVIETGHQSDVYVCSSLVDMYAKCGSIEDACRVFIEMPTHDVVSWNAMILGYVKYGLGQKALDGFYKMQEEGVDPDPVTFVGVLSACASVGALEVGRHVHQWINHVGIIADICRGVYLISGFLS